MRKTKKVCEECGEEEMGAGPLRDKVWWGHQQNREIIINGVIDESIVEKLVMQIHLYNSADDAGAKEYERLEISGFKRDPITIFIHSPGGGVGCSFAAVSAIEASKTPIVTVAIGEAMSGGFLILLSGHTRYAQRYATLMYHELSSMAAGKSTEVREYGEYLDRLQQRISDYVLTNSLIPPEKLEECHMRKQDWYMDTEEALQYGVVDGIWPPDVYQFEEEECCEEEESEEYEDACDECLSTDCSECKLEDSGNK